MNYVRLNREQVAKILPKFDGEDATYLLLPKGWFEKSRLEKLFGCREWWFSMGGSDCGKFTLRLLADIAERYSETFCRWGSSGGGDSSSFGVGRFADHSDAPLLGFCKYTRRDGQCHICGVTILEEKPNQPYFFERTTKDICDVRMNKEEFDSIEWIRAV